MKLTRQSGILGTIFEIKKVKIEKRHLYIHISINARFRGKQNFSITFIPMWPNGKLKEN